MEPVKIAAVQAAPVLLDRDATVAKVVALCENAAAEGAGCVLEHPGVGGRIWLGSPPVVVPGARASGGRDASACGFGELYGPVHGCPWNWRHGSPRARTYSGQRRGRQPREVSFPQVSGHVEVQAGACCKTVGSAYVGSNPTPAT
jgi:hypothetical protein